jgi:hypothetical protein
VCVDLTMGIFWHKRLTTLAALLLTLVTYAISPPDAFCRTQSGNRTRCSRTVRLDDQDHDHSPDVRSDQHDCSARLGVNLFIGETSTDGLKVALVPLFVVEPEPEPICISVSTPSELGRAPPVVLP